MVVLNIGGKKTDILIYANPNRLRFFEMTDIDSVEDEGVVFPITKDATFFQQRLAGYTNTMEGLCAGIPDAFIKGLSGYYGGTPDITYILLAFSGKRLVSFLMGEPQYKSKVEYIEDEETGEEDIKISNILLDVVEVKLVCTDARMSGKGIASKLFYIFNEIVSKTPRIRRVCVDSVKEAKPFYDSLGFDEIEKKGKMGECNMVRTIYEGNSNNGNGNNGSNNGNNGRNNNNNRKSKGGKRKTRKGRK